jgi:hypothetical protein
MDGWATLVSSDATFIVNVDLRCAAKLLRPVRHHMFEVRFLCPSRAEAMSRRAIVVLISYCEVALTIQLPINAVNLVFFHRPSNLLHRVSRLIHCASKLFRRASKLLFKKLVETYANTVQF